MRKLIQFIFLLISAFKSRGAEEVIYAQVGDTVTLKPPPELYSQKYYVRWFFGKEDGPQLAWCNYLGGKFLTADADWTGRLSLSDSSLVIKSIQQENFGTFVFKSTDTGIYMYKILKLTVTVKPPSPLLLPGDSLSLSCDTEDKKPDIHWLNPQGDKVRNNQGLLTIRATGQDSGQWTCVVTNEKKQKQAKVSVTVVDLSPAPLHPQYTSQSWPLAVPCSLPAHISWQQIAAKDIQRVHWYFIPKIASSPQMLFNLSLDKMRWTPHQNRGLRAVSDPRKGNLSLIRNRGRKDDAGDYVCSLEFKNAVTLNRTVHVQVLQIISYPGTELISGQQLNLTCSLGHPLPSDLRMKWSPPEQSSLSSLTSDRHPAHLFIPEVRTEDGGKWMCELWQSETRLTLVEITLKIEPKLSAWMLVVICSVTVIVVILLILVFILCRRRQRKMRHLRRKLCQCKTPKPKGFYRT